MSARIVQTADGFALDMPCPKYGHCHPRPPVHRDPPQEATATTPRIWQWIGPEDAPTIIPSIGCDAKCGQHRSIINGKW